MVLWETFISSEGNNIHMAEGEGKLGLKGKPYRFDALGIDARVDEGEDLEFLSEPVKNVQDFHITQDEGTIRYPAHSDTSLRIFMQAMAEAIQFYDSVHVYDERPTQPLDDKINSFLMRNTGSTFEEFTNDVEIDGYGDEFVMLAKRGLKFRLFNYRARVYLAALAAAEDAGYAPKEVLRKLKLITVSPIKKSRDEPVFEYLAEKLGVR